MKRNVAFNEEGAAGPVSFSDSEIAAAAVDAIQWLTTIPPETVKLTVQNGWVTLEGAVDWWHQRDTLGDIVRHVPGVKGLSNFITLKSEFAQETAA
jgi:osmotically-inducible protein OsmY